ncbi:MAG: NAD-dependent epimerase/dehydratase family protein [Deltaproteobacteria bacterium]|nr:NAD-dependent epimerase/dehydratase family protein [Deltaproteobacteria bacterium]
MATPPRRLLITGATGFLGRHVLQALRADQPETRALALCRRRADWNRQPWTAPLDHVDVIEGGVTGPEGWTGDRRLKGCAGLVHLAAVVRHSRRDPADLYETNVDGTLRMVRLAAQLGCPMVFVSTSGTVGCFESPDEKADEDAPYVERTVGGWPYYDSKIRAERKARALAAQLGVPLTLVRPPILLGPGDHRLRSTGHVLKYLRGAYPFLIEGGMSFVDVRDAAPAILRALDHPARRPVYHLNGTDCGVVAFFELCRQVCGVRPPDYVLPFAIAHRLATAAERVAHLTGRKSPLPDPVVLEMGRHYWGLASLHAERELGFRARPPRQTLADTIDWLRRNTAV